MEIWTPELALFGIVVCYFLVVTIGIGLSRALAYHRRKGKDAKITIEKPVDSVRRRLQLWLYATTRIGSFLDLLQGGLSAVSCGLYVWETYQTKDDVQYHDIVGVLETMLSVIFLMDYWLRFFLAKNRLAYVWSLMGVVDVITVLPVFVYISLPSSAHAAQEAPMYLRLVRLIKFLRVLRSLRIVRATLGFGLRRRLFTLIFSVVSLIFVAAGGFHFIEERSGRGMEFHTALYYTTIETLGRPRIESMTDEGYLWLIALVVVSVVLIPKQLAELFSVARSETVWQRRRYERHSMRHIVLTGHQDFGSVNILLYEFYHKDRGYHSSDVVLFFEQPPTREVEMLLEHPAYVSHVQYVQGSPLVEDDLARVGISSASAVLVLANKNPHDVFWEDCRITSTILSCKAFWQRTAHEQGMKEKRSSRPDRGLERPSRLRILSQVLKPETRHQLLRTPGWQHDDVILVIGEFSSLMVGLNALHRGFTTLIFNLFSHVEEQLSAPAWYREYEQGACQEIYRVCVSDSLAGAEMTEVAAYLLLECRVVLLAMESAPREEDVPRESSNSGLSSGGRSNSGGVTAGVDLVLYPGRRGVKLKRGDFIYCIAYNIFLVTHTNGSVATTSVMGEDRLLEAAETKNHETKNHSTPRDRNTIHNFLRSSYGHKDAKKSRQSVCEWAVSHRMSQCCRTSGVDRWTHSERHEEHDAAGVDHNVSRTSMASVSELAQHTRVHFDMANEQLCFQSEQPPQHESMAEGEDTQVFADKNNSRVSETDSAPPLEPPPAKVPPTRSTASSPRVCPDNCAARKRVLDWLLAEGYGGDQRKMREEVASYLIQAASVSGGLGDNDDLKLPPTEEEEVPCPQAHHDRSLLLSDMKASMMMETTHAVFWRVPAGLENHVVIFGATLSSGLRDLARLVLLKSDRSLVILSPEAKKLVEAASQDGWLKSLSEAGPRGGRRLFFVKGSPASPSMLDRVCLKKASAAIFLPCVPPEGLAAEATERQHRMIDSTTVALTNFAAGEVETGLWTVTQLLHGAAVKFFTDHSAWRSGSADPRWLDIAPLNTHALFAAGQIVAGTMLDRLLIETHFNDKAIPLCGLFIFGDEAGARLFEGPLPEGFAGHSYDDLCRYLLDLQLLPIGLLRDSHRSYSHIFRMGHTGSISKGSEEKKRDKSFFSFSASRPRLKVPFFDFTEDLRRTSAPILDTSCEAQLPYVVTNPEPRLVLKENDRIFVIGLPSWGAGDGPAAAAQEEAKAAAKTPQEVNSSLLSNFLYRDSFMNHEYLQNPTPPPMAL